MIDACGDAVLQDCRMGKPQHCLLGTEHNTRVAGVPHGLGRHGDNLADFNSKQHLGARAASTASPFSSQF